MADDEEDARSSGVVLTMDGGRGNDGLTHNSMNGE